MAVAAIVAPSASPADPALDAVALNQTLAADPTYGRPFCRALARAIRYVNEGIPYEPPNATHYRIQSRSRAWVWHYVSLHGCSCDTRAPWCWHRALLLLLMAHAALRQLDHFPGPSLAYARPRTPRAKVTLLRKGEKSR